jgi:hypothetical protein
VEERTRCDRIMNMLDMQRVAACGKAIARLDTEIAAAHAGGYSVDADRLLDERRDWQLQRDALIHAARADGR